MPLGVASLFELLIVCCNVGATIVGERSEAVNKVLISSLIDLRELTVVL